MNRDHLADVSYPVVFKFDNQELMTSRDSKKEIAFHAYGQGWDLLKLKLNWFVDPIEINIQNKKKFKYILSSQIRPYLEDRLPELDIRYFLTDTIYTGLDKVKKVKMKVYLDREEIDLAKDYKIDGTIRISPEYVMATGPSSVLDSMAHKIVIRLSDSDIADAYKEEISIPEPASDLVSYDTKKVEVAFGVTKFKRPFTE
ncbi:MAG: hypothetical protein ACTHJT_11185 [Cytophaga sp.]|uniref:hypothetical protein n=1 Tax=Cytophaga sp. TaxID=29535 RepID=UPI003F80AEED